MGSRDMKQRWKAEGGFNGGVAQGAGASSPPALVKFLNACTLPLVVLYPKIAGEVNGETAVA
jgi:hypothetical protein